MERRSRDEGAAGSSSSSYVVDLLVDERDDLYRSFSDFDSELTPEHVLSDGCERRLTDASEYPEIELNRSPGGDGIDGEEDIMVITTTSSQQYEQPPTGIDGNNYRSTTVSGLDHAFAMTSVAVAAEKERQSKEEKRVARAVMLVAGTLILMSLILVGVTLSMSDHIDEMGYY